MIKFHKYAFTFVGIFLLAFISTSKLQAQKKKELEIGIDTLLNQQKYDYAMPLLRLWLIEEPDDALATYRLATTYHESIKTLYVHQEDVLRTEYDSAIRIYERAIGLIDRKELRRNKDFYTVYFGTKDYTEANVKELYEERIKQLEDYYGKLAFIRLRLNPISRVYNTLEINFRAIVSRYPKIPDLYKFATEDDISILRSLQSDHKILEQSIKDYEQVFFDKRDLSNRHFQKFSLQPIDGINIYRINPEDFKRKELALFDFGDWAEQILYKIQKFNKLKSQMESMEKDVSMFMLAHPVDTHIPSSRISEPLAIWKQQLLQFDQHATVPDLLAYKVKKWDVMIEEEQVRDLFKRTYPDKETRDALINGLVKKLTGLGNELKTIKTDSSLYLTYKDFVDKYYGGVGKLNKWKIMESNYITQRLLHWNSIRAKAVSLPQRMPDFLYYGNSKLLLRPAKFSLTMAQDSGFYINEQIFYLPDSSFISQGRYGKDNTPYIAQIDTARAVIWMHNFPDTVERAKKISQLHIYPKGTICYFAHREKDGAERVSLEVLGLDGRITYSRIIASVPEKIFHVNEPVGIIFLRESKQGEGQSSFTRYAIEAFGFGKNSKPIFTQFLLRGHLVNMLPYKGGLYLVANFLELQDAEGNFSDSRAYSQGGFNVLTLNVSLKKQQAKYNPIFSMIPIIVTNAELETDGKLRLTGLQGAYKYYGPDNISGGEPWLRYVTE